MFSLVTQADGTSRGQPWVTYAVTVALVVGFVSLQRGEASQQSAAIDAKVEEAMAYFEAHPYLELDSRLVARAGGEHALEELRDEHFAEQRERGLSVIPASIIRRTQRKLDQMLEAASAEQRELPQWRLGVLDASTPASNLFSHVVVHTTWAALLVSLFFVFCLASAIEGGWGPLPLAGLCALTVPLVGAAYGQLEGASGSPWHGAGGLVAVLLGAYFVRSIRWPALLLGGLPLPGWLMIAIWLPADHLLVRGLGVRDWSTGPFAVYALAFGVGIAAAVFVRQLGIEEKLRRRDEKKAEVFSNPVLDKALAAHESGQTAEAYEMLKVEVEANPKHRDLVVGFWTVARACGAAGEAAPFLLAVVRRDLQRGKRSEAAAHWLEIADAAPHIEAESALLVRLGEALIDEGQPNDALLTFARALDEPARITAPLALRILRIARDLDPAMSSRAATVALADPQLDPEERERLKALHATLEPSAARPTGPTLETSAVSSEPTLEPSVVRRSESTDSSGAAVTAAASSDGEAALQDASAVSSSSLLDVAAETPAEFEVERWNAPGLVEDLSSEIGEDVSETGEYEAMDFGAVSLEEVSTEALASDDDPDGTAPILASMDEAGDQTGRTTAVEGIEDESDVDSVSDLEFGATKRMLRLLGGVPVNIDADGIKVEIDGRGKTRIPFDRVEAVAVATVGGIAEKPVLLIDLVLNWMSSGGEPLRVVRLRSDRFRPGSLVPEAESTIDALKALLATILDSSGATPLPHAEAARGEEFVRFEGLDEYHAQVLMVNGLAD